jgi:hypothetical protein
MAMKHDSNIGLGELKKTMKKRSQHRQCLNEDSKGEPQEQHM